MGRILSALLIITALLFSNAPKGESGDKPTFMQGFINIKLKPETFKSQQLIIDNSSKSYSLTGIKSLDELNMKHQASNMKQPFIKATKKNAEQYGFERWFKLEIPEESDVWTVLADYKEDPNIESAAPEALAYTTAIPNDPLYDDHWGHNNTSQLYSYNWSTNLHNGPQVGTVGWDTNAPVGWDGTQAYGSTSIIIAIVDTGVDYLHPDLAANCVAGYDYGSNDSDPMDDGNHGTCCAGVAAGRVNNSVGVAGVAGNCKIMPVKIGVGTSLSSTGIVNGIIHCGNNDVDVASCSFSGDYDMGYNTAMDDAYAYAYDNGVTILAATSNYNKSHIYYPAIHTNVIAVGAASADNGRKRSSSSSTEVNSGVDTDPNGYTIDGERWWGSCYGIDTKDARQAVDIIAPTILPTTDRSGDVGYVTIGDTSEPYGDPFDDGNYEMFFNGTSCATPYAAGFAALIKSKYPSYTPDQIRSYMRNTAIDVVNVESAVGWDRYSGYGMVNLAALNYEVDAPGSLDANPVSISEIDLSWTKNSSNNDILVVWSSTGTFGSPVDGTNYSSGNTISGGGTVLYSGSALSYNHTSLTDNTLYYYRVYSYNSSKEYSFYLETSARTLMAPLNPSAASMGFENSGSIPLGWTQEGNWTFVTTATRPTAPSEGSYFAYYATTSSTKKIVTPRFDLTDYTGVTISFDYLVSSRKVGPTTWYDHLKVYYKTSSTGSWVLLSSDLTGSYTAWQTLTLNISDAVITDDFYFAFEATIGSTLGYGVSVDDVVVNGTYSGGGTPPASAPTLVSPANTSSTSDLTPTFDWDDVTGATSYTILVDNNSSFGSPEISQSPTSSTYTPASDMTTGTYYWKVLATNAYGSSSYSSTWTVTLGSAPAVPSLASPSDASTLYILQPTFDWNDVTGATSYTILVDNNASFGSPEIDQSPTVSTYTPGSDMALGTYYWKVLSTNTFGSSSYSSTYTVILAPLTAPINVTTIDSGTDVTVSWDAVTGATSYDVYSSTDPYGTFTFVTNVSTNSYLAAATETKLFWYVVAKN